MTIKVDTTTYCRETGASPRGRRYWCFMLITDRVTERDHYYNPHKEASYPSALRDAIELAGRRRCHTVKVMP